MLSRLFWVGIAGVAVITGMVLQDGDQLFGWGHEVAVATQTGRSIEAKVERAVEASVERAVNSGADGMRVMDGEGNEIEVPPETKRAMAEAVGRLVKAQADLAILKVRDAAEGEMQAATARRDQARADVDRLKAEIKGLEQAAAIEQDAVREQVRQEVRDQIRDTVREAVRS